MANIKKIPGTHLKNNISKRDALKAFMLLTTGVFQLVHGFNPLFAKSSSKNKLKGERVVIVGAGVSGLVAANLLKQTSAEVIILEATDYIGGRVKTDWSLGAPFEYGAGWIHGPSPDNPIKQLADEAGGEYFITDDDSIELLDISGNDMSSEIWDEIEEIWQEVFYEIYDDPKVSFLDLINEYDETIWNDPNVRWIFSAFTEFDFGGPLNQISASLTNQMSAFPTEDVILTNGYNKVVDLLSKGIDITLNSAVKKIDYQKEEIFVHTNDTSYTCDYLICSVPLGVLKAGKIKFNPPLPNFMANSIKNIGFGSVTKLAIKFNDQFWDDDVQYYYTVVKQNGRWPIWMNYRTFSDEKILLGLCVGEYALKADLMSDKEILEDALEVLKTVWEDDVGSVKKIIRTSWLTEPYFKGAYSFPSTQSSEEDFENFSESLNDQIYFCGEHTNLQYLATTHGALMSGIRAAKEVIKADGSV